ncbi:alpha/beta fold hydrolase [Streptomyces sp. NPDC002784]
MHGGSTRPRRPDLRSPGADPPRAGVRPCHRPTPQPPTPAISHRSSGPTPPAAPLPCSCTGCGCCPPAGTGGRPSSKSVGQVAQHFCGLIGKLERKPVVIGHSFGGLITQIIAGRELSQASVAIDPAPFRGVLPLPLSSLRAARPVLGNPANLHRAVPLTFEQFRYSFANAVSEEEARELYDTFAVPAPGEPLFQAAAANINPWTEVKVDTTAAGRGPLLIISGEKDNTVPWAIANAADTALTFIQRFAR